MTQPGNTPPLTGNTAVLDPNQQPDPNQAPAGAPYIPAQRAPGGPADPNQGPTTQEVHERINQIPEIAFSPNLDAAIRALAQANRAADTAGSAKSAAERKAAQVTAEAAFKTAVAAETGTGYSMVTVAMSARRRVNCTQVEQSPQPSAVNVLTQRFGLARLGNWLKGHEKGVKITKRVIAALGVAVAVTGIIAAGVASGGLGFWVAAGVAAKATGMFAAYRGAKGAAAGLVGGLIGGRLAAGSLVKQNNTQLATAKRIDAWNVENLLADEAELADDENGHTTYLQRTGIAQETRVHEMADRNVERRKEIVTKAARKGVWNGLLMGTTVGAGLHGLNILTSFHLPTAGGDTIAFKHDLLPDGLKASHNDPSQWGKASHDALTTNKGKTGWALAERDIKANGKTMIGSHNPQGYLMESWDEAAKNGVVFDHTTGLKFEHGHFKPTSEHYLVGDYNARIPKGKVLRIQMPDGDVHEYTGKLRTSQLAQMSHDFHVKGHTVLTDQQGDALKADWAQTHVGASEAPADMVRTHATGFLDRTPRASDLLYEGELTGPANIDPFYLGGAAMGGAVATRELSKAMDTYPQALTREERADENALATQDRSAQRADRRDARRNRRNGETPDELPSTATPEQRELVNTTLLAIQNGIGELPDVDRADVNTRIRAVAEVLTPVIDEVRALPAAELRGLIRQALAPANLTVQQLQQAFELAITESEALAAQAATAPQTPPTTTPPTTTPPTTTTTPPTTTP